MRPCQMDSPPRFKAAHRHQTLTTTFPAAWSMMKQTISWKTGFGDVLTYNCMPTCFHECIDISCGLLSVRQALISARLLVLFYFIFCHCWYEDLFWCGFWLCVSSSPPITTPGTDVTYISSWHRDLKAPTNWQRPFRSETQHAAEPHTTSFH